MRIFLYDDNKNIINELDYKLEDVQPNGTTPTFSTLRENLSNCSYYSVALVK